MGCVPRRADARSAGLPHPPRTARARRARVDRPPVHRRPHRENSAPESPDAPSGNARPALSCAGVRTPDRLATGSFRVGSASFVGEPGPNGPAMDVRARAARGCAAGCADLGVTVSGDTRLPRSHAGPNGASPHALRVAAIGPHGTRFRRRALRPVLADPPASRGEAAEEQQGSDGSCLHPRSIASGAPCSRPELWQVQRHEEFVITY